MLLKSFKLSTIICFIVCCVVQCEIAASYKTEIAITAAPVEEVTTKKSGGFFGGIKSWFGGGSDTTTAVPVVSVTTPKAPTNVQVSSGQAPSPQNAQRPPPLQIQPAPLMPLGPRPDTPLTSPWDSNPQQPPQWPQQPQVGGAAGKPLPPQWPQAVSASSGGPAKTNGSPTAGGPASGSNSQQPQLPHPAGSASGGNVQQQPQPTGSASTVGFAVPTATSTGLKPTQPQSTHTVQNNVPRPGVGQPHISQSQVANNMHNNSPRPYAGQPNLPPGFSSYQPPKTQPSGFDLSYGGSSRPVQPAGRPSSGVPSGLPTLAGTSTSTATSTSTSTSTTTSTSKPGPIDFDLRGHTDMKEAAKNNFPTLPTTRRPSIKEEFPALPAPKSPTPASPVSPSSPSAWNKPLPTPVAVTPASTPTTAKTPTPNAPAAPAGPGGNRVSFVPHSGPTSTMRPGFQSNAASNSLATDTEIQTLTEALYNKEANSQLNLITVNPQGKTRSIDSTDEAPKPLLEINEKAFENPTIAKMRLLFNNYEMDTLTNEHVTPNERKEENDFVDAVMATSVMRQAMLFLQNKGIVGPDPKTHRDMIKELWFTQYSRGSGKIGSSGFEHVFVNEVKNGTIIGLHNWVYYYEEEKAGRLDYKGYLNQLDLGTKGKVIKMRFTHNGLNKPVNSMFIGTSPELELALYTVCFKLRADTTCPVSLGNSKFGVVTYSWRYRGKNLIGSAFPEI